MVSSDSMKPRSPEVAEVCVLAAVEVRDSIGYDGTAAISASRGAGAGRPEAPDSTSPVASLADAGGDSSRSPADLNSGSAVDRDTLR